MHNMTISTWVKVKIKISKLGHVIPGESWQNNHISTDYKLQIATLSFADSWQNVFVASIDLGWPPTLSMRSLTENCTWII